MNKYQYLLKKKKAESWAFSCVNSVYHPIYPIGWTITPFIWIIPKPVITKSPIISMSPKVPLTGLFIL